MKKIVISCLVLLSYLEVYPQVDTAWVRRYNGTGNNADIANGIAVDTEGNVYVTGNSINNEGNVVCITIKYNTIGEAVWADEYRGYENSGALGNVITVDTQENVYIAGYGGGLSYTLDFFTLKYNSSGDTLWARYYDGGAGSPDYVHAIAVDNKGNVYVTGESTGMNTYEDYATIKYNSAGVLQWAARYAYQAQLATDKANAIAVDGGGNVYVTGGSEVSYGYYDYATVKYDSSGAEKWVARYDGPGNYLDIAVGIALDDSANVYVTGYSTGIGTSYDYATVKYDSSGIEKWVARYEIAPGYYSTDMADAIALYGEGNVYVTGTIGMPAGGAGGDYATIKYNREGEEQWIAAYDSAGSADQASAIALDREGNVYVTGLSAYSNLNDYATVKYNPAGQEQWAIRYNGPADAWDVPSAIAVDSAENVYVTGYSWGLNQNFDYLTIKYTPETVGKDDNPGTLSQNHQFQVYPNPFYSFTEISFVLSATTFVSLKVFDLFGREVVTLINKEIPAGKYSRLWDTENLPGGVYYCRLQAGGNIGTAKLILLK